MSGSTNSKAGSASFVGGLLGSGASWPLTTTTRAALSFPAAASVCEVCCAARVIASLDISETTRQRLRELRCTSEAGLCGE
jgi:hypothetical protein